MTEREKEIYLEMFHSLTKSIEELIRIRSEIERRLLLHDELCIHPEERNLPSKYRLE